jgi:hypothetical protein
MLFGTLVADTIWASAHVRAHRQVGHMDASDLIKALQNTLRGRGRSLIAPPLSTAFCLLLLLSPYQGHGSLHGRRMPPQHPVRSTGAVMSTTGSRGNHMAQRPPSQPACTLALAGNPHIRADARMDPDCLATRPGLALAPTSGTACRSSRCCAGSRTARGQAPRGLCRHRSASRAPAPSPSSAKPA